MSYKIKQELKELYIAVKAEYPQLADEMVEMFLANMPAEAMCYLNERQYGEHVATKTMYEHAINKLTKGEHWTIADVSKIAAMYVNVDDEAFYINDIALMANFLYSTIGHIVTDATNIVKVSISLLKFDDTFSYWIAKKLTHEHKEEHEK